MPNIFSEMATLRREGKLHSRLVSRTRLYLGISVLLLCVALYFIFTEGGNALLALVLAIVGLLAGYFIFSLMMRVQWNKSTEQVEAASMNWLGYGMIALYIAFEVIARTTLGDLLGSAAEAYILSLIFGVIFGRTLGVMVDIHRVYKAEHAK